MAFTSRRRASLQGRGRPAPAARRSRAQRTAWREFAAELRRGQAAAVATARPALTLATYLHAVGVWGEHVGSALTELGIGDDEEVEWYGHLCARSGLVEQTGVGPACKSVLARNAFSVLSALTDATPCSSGHTPPPVRSTGGARDARSPRRDAGRRTRGRPCCRGPAALGR